MKFLILSFLLSFSVFGETAFKVKSALSVSGGYVTSLSKFDGGFGISTANFTVSTGTLTRASDATMEGNYLGSWATTATGTLDTIAQTISATGTYELSYIANTTAYANGYICAVINTVENACKLVAQNTLNQKLSWVGNLNTNDSVKIRYKHTGTTATIKVDNFKMEPWTPQGASLNVSEAITMSGYTSRNASTQIKFTTTLLNRAGTYLTLDNSGDYTKITTNKKCIFNVTSSAGVSSADSVSFYIIRKNAAGTIVAGGYNAVNTSTLGLSSSMTGEADIGDNFSVIFAGGTPSNTVYTNLSFTCSAATDNVIQTWQDGRGTFKSLTYTEVNALSGNQGLGQYAAGSMEYMVGADGLLHVKGKLTAGTVGVDEVRIALPAGFISANTDKIPSIQVTGVMARDSNSEYVYSSLIEPNVRYFTVSAQGTSLNSLTKLGGASFPNGIQLSFNFSIPVQGVSSTPTLLALPVSKENTFTASSSSTGVLGNMTGSNGWMTYVSKGGTGIYNYTVNSSIFTEFPKISADVVGNSGNGAYITYGTFPAFEIRIRDNDGTYRDWAHQLKATKSIADYTPAGVFVGNITPDNFVQTSGAMNPVFFSFTFGTTNATTVCSASPCSYLDQIGNYVTSVTRASTGLYTANFSRTFSKVKCSFVGMIAGVGSVFLGNSGLNGQCVNTNSCTLASIRSSTEVLADSNGTLMCMAIP